MSEPPKIAPDLEERSGATMAKTTSNVILGAHHFTGDVTLTEEDCKERIRRHSPLVLQYLGSDVMYAITAAMNELQREAQQAKRDLSMVNTQRMQEKLAQGVLLNTLKQLCRDEDTLAALPDDIRSIVRRTGEILLVQEYSEDLTGHEQFRADMDEGKKLADYAASVGGLARTWCIQKNITYKGATVSNENKTPVITVHYAAHGRPVEFSGLTRLLRSYLPAGLGHSQLKFEEN